jgi:hypothetical protein
MVAASKLMRVMSAVLESTSPLSQKPTKLTQQERASPIPSTEQN